MTISAPTPIDAPSIPPQMALMQMIMGSWVSQIIYVAAKLGIADLLKDGAQHYQSLAQKTQTHADSLYRLLRSLASIGLFIETEPDVFEITELAQFLRSDIPGSACAAAIMFGEEHYQAWGSLLHSVQTGESAFGQCYGMQIFEYYAQNPEPAKIFDQAMTSFSAIEQDAVIASYDFSTVNTVVDVAGGHGSLLTTVLKTNPHLKGILYDLPAVIEGAKPLIEAAGLSDRCQLVAGSFFETIPTDGDLYMFKHIIHDWDDERSIAILKTCRQAIPTHGKVLLIEQVIPPGNDPFMGKLLDINMLVMCPGGRERTQAEYQHLFEQSGFQFNRLIPTPADVSLVEGSPQ